MMNFIFTLMSAHLALAQAPPAPAAAAAPMPDIVVTGKAGHITVLGQGVRLDGVSINLIPEILALPDNSTVPWNVMKDGDPKAIAASLIRRLHESREQDANEKQPAYNYVRDTMIQMRFPDKFLGLIWKNGFLNQHMTGKSNGALDGARRARIEDSLVRERLEDAYRMGKTTANYVRPKYAFLGYPEDTDGQQRGHFTRSYGNVIAVFKEEVKLRSTFTPIDTLNGDVNPAGELAYGRVRGRSFYFRGAQRLSKMVDLFKDASGAPLADFWEAQIWGPITIQDDVAYFLVNCPKEPKPSAKNFAAMKLMKIPIYKCEFVKDHSHFDRGDLLN